MLFFLIVLFVIILVFIIIALLMLSTIRVEIKNFEFYNFKLNENYKIKISISLFNKLKLLWLTIDKKTLEKISSSVRMKKFNIQKIRGKVKFNKDTFKILTKINLERLKLKVNLGLEDAPITSYVVATIASIIGILIPKVSKKIVNCKYNINPIYNGENQIYIKLNSITSIKIVHIIYVIYILNMKGRDKNERTSNRRSYGYSYGQY